MSTTALAVRNVRPMGGDVGDLFIHNGSFVSELPLGPVREINGRGSIALPGMIESHTHMDKSLLGMPWYRQKKFANRKDRIDYDYVVRKELGIDAHRQSARQARHTLAFGVTHVRTHADVDTDIGTASVDGLLATRELFKGVVDIQVVAFPASGWLVRPGSIDVMTRAMEAGADVVGGMDPSEIDRDPKGNLDTMFSFAQHYGRPIDIHLHERGELGAFSLELIIERTRALSMQGRVMVSHGLCLGDLSEPRLGQMLDGLAGAEITVMTTGPQPPHIPPPIKRLREAGVVVALGTDGVRSTWNPYGTGDMLDRTSKVAQRNGFRSDEDIEMTFNSCTFGNATGLQLTNYGIAPGCQGDLVLVDGETLVEAIINRPARSLVISSGHVVAENGVLASGVPGQNL